MAMDVLCELLERVLPADGPVLLLGPRAAQLAASPAGPLASREVLRRGQQDVLRPGASHEDAPADAAVAWSPTGPASTEPLLTQDPPRGTAAACVVLDGPETALTPDDEPLTHAGLLDLARATLRPGGVLVALVGNDLTSPLPRSPRRDVDADWWVGSPGFDRRRPHAGELAALAPGARVLSVLPTLPSPYVLAGSAVPPAQLEAALATLSREVVGVAAARRAVEADALPQLAAGWVVVEGPVEEAALPDDVLLVGDARPAGPGTARTDLAQADLAQTDLAQTALAQNALARPDVDREGPAAETHRLRDDLADRDRQVRWLQERYAQQERRIRALEQVVDATEGPFARRMLLVLTAPASRLTEAVRARRR
ncbi:hypothetical protein GCM10027070_33380 [Barrientosiimonas humi]